MTRRGFTLPEAIISIIILSIAGTAAFSILTTAAKTWRASEFELRRTSALSNAAKAIESELSVCMADSISIMKSPTVKGSMVIGVISPRNDKGYMLLASDSPDSPSAGGIVPAAAAVIYPGQEGDKINLYKTRKDAGREMADLGFMESFISARGYEKLRKSTLIRDIRSVTFEKTGESGRTVYFSIGFGKNGTIRGAAEIMN